MVYRGHVENGVVLLDEAARLPEGAEVRIELIASGPQQQAIALIDLWLADESAYDESTWPSLKADLDRDRLSSRRLFDG